MKKNYLFLWLLLILFITLIFSPKNIFCQVTKRNRKSLIEKTIEDVRNKNQLIELLESEETDKRDDALYKIDILMNGMFGADLYTLKTEEDIEKLYTIVNELSSSKQLLNIAIEVMNEAQIWNPPAYGSESDQKYLGLLYLLAYSGDKKAIPIVIKCMDRIGGGPLSESIAHGGDVYLEPLLRKAKDKKTKWNFKTKVLRIFEEMIESKQLEKTHCLEIKGFLKNSLKDSNRFIRINSIRALSALGDEDVIPLLEDIAENDTYYYHPYGKRGRDKTIRIYSVRESAKKALEELKRIREEEKEDLEEPKKDNSE